MKTYIETSQKFTHIFLVFFILFFEMLQHINKNFKSIYIRVYLNLERKFDPLNVVQLNLTFFNYFKFDL
jgi:hypothetical protein